MSENNGRPAPKDVAAQKVGKLCAHVQRLQAQVGGYSQAVDDDLANLIPMITAIEQTLAALPPETRRARRTSGKRAIKKDQLYAIKPKYKALYALVAGDDDVEACLALREDDGNVVVMFPNEVRALVKKTHLGKEVV